MNGLDEFLQMAHQNERVTLEASAELPGIRQVDSLFLLGKDVLSHPTGSNAVPGFYLMAYYSYLNAVRLALAGQNVATHQVLRGGLESALYGLHIQVHPHLHRTWVRRHESDEARKLAQRAFRMRRRNNESGVLDTLREKNSRLARAVDKLYEQTIDDGSHPNPRGYYANMDRETDESGKVTDRPLALNPGSTAHEWALLSSTRVGFACLRIFEIAFGRRFEIVGLSSALRESERSLKTLSSFRRC